ncbi:MAG: hypothetical protein WD423_16605 [Rhodothermales bacterium]
MRGIYVSLAEDDLAAYLVTLGPDGRIDDRERISPADRNVWSQTEDIAPPPGVDVPTFAPPPGDYLPGEWNTVDVMVYESTVSGMSGFERSEGHRGVGGGLQRGRLYGCRGRIPLLARAGVFGLPGILSVRVVQSDEDVSGPLDV